PAFTSPAFTSPAFTSPAFTSPGMASHGSFASPSACTAPRIADPGLSMDVSPAVASPGDDEDGGEDEGDELVMIDRSERKRCRMRRAALHEPRGLEIHHPVAFGYHGGSGVRAHQVKHGLHVHTSTRSARASASARSAPTMCPKA